MFTEKRFRAPQFVDGGIGDLKSFAKALHDYLLELESPGALTITEAAEVGGQAVKIKNAGGLYWENAAGVLRVVLQMYSDDNVYLDAQDGDLVFRTTTSQTERLRLTSDGRLYGKALHNNSGSVTGATNQFIASGSTVFTPTWASVLNLDGTPTTSSVRFTRLGNVVRVDGGVTYDPTAAGTVSFTSTLPIASDLSGSTLLLSGGIGSPSDIGQINGDNANPGKAQFSITAVGTGSRTVPYWYSYEVI